MPGKSKKDKIVRKLGGFLQQYQRKSQRGVEPNDRQYDRKIEAQLKKLPPEELSELLSGEGDDDK
ncbi:MAG: hypothetical protein B7X64_06110 [Halothiobacillus sp. 39-53-45]|jgi:hypothetical protein|nr:MAG: hypothetical protein B7X64_06110 [Halothiobacillus sp. 39-53-45]